MSDAAGRPGAVCAVLLDGHGRLLAVSRKDDPDDLGLPGGKVEPGESPADALRREVHEETGLAIVGEPRAVFEREDHGFRSVTYYAAGWTGETAASEPGRIAWVEPERLCRGTFGEYNTRLVAALRRQGILPP